MMSRPATNKERGQLDQGKACVLSVRVLVVDDYEPLRRFVCSTLGKKPELHVIGEVSDGLEAVRKAEELQPDLILLDIGLPTLNGIEAARQIRKLAPEFSVKQPYEQSNEPPASRFRALSRCAVALRQPRSVHWPKAAAVERRRT